MQFLLEGARNGEKVLYLTLSESEEEQRAAAAAHGWALDGVEIVELISPDSLVDEKQQQSLLYSSDLELVETTRRAELEAKAAEEARLTDSGERGVRKETAGLG